MENNFTSIGKDKLPLYPNEVYQNEQQSSSSGINLNNILPLLLSTMQGGSTNDAIRNIISQSGMDKNPLMQVFSSLSNQKKGSPAELPVNKTFPKNENYS